MHPIDPTPVLTVAELEDRLRVKCKRQFSKLTRAADTLEHERTQGVMQSHLDCIAALMSEDAWDALTVLDLFWSMIKEVGADPALPESAQAEIAVVLKTAVPIDSQLTALIAIAIERETVAGRTLH